MQTNRHTDGRTNDYVLFSLRLGTSLAPDLPKMLKEMSLDMFNFAQYTSSIERHQRQRDRETQTVRDCQRRDRQYGEAGGGV